MMNLSCLLIVLCLSSHITLTSGSMKLLAAFLAHAYDAIFQGDGLKPFDPTFLAHAYDAIFQGDGLKTFDPSFLAHAYDAIFQKGGLKAFGPAFLAYAYYAIFHGDGVKPFDPKRLEADLRQSLYGQHIASEVILKAVSSFMTDSNPNKPLVLSFHGTSGVGKNHVAKIIARNIYKKGEESMYVSTFISELDFPNNQLTDKNSAKLIEWIHKKVSSFPRSMFIFDEMDKMNPKIIETIKPYLDYNAHLNGVSYRNAIFIFLSNAGGQVITDLTLDFLRNGKQREEIRINSKELEMQIVQNVFSAKNSGFQHSSLLDHHLIDHFIPFLPLELKHVRQCVLSEMAHLNMTEDFELAEKVARDMPFFPPENIFAVKGCKSVRQKLVLYDDD